MRVLVGENFHRICRLYFFLRNKQKSTGIELTESLTINKLRLQGKQSCTHQHCFLTNFILYNYLQRFGSNYLTTIRMKEPLGKMTNIGDEAVLMRAGVFPLQAKLTSEAA